MCEMCLGRVHRLVVRPGPAAAQQFRMQFPSGSVLVRVSTHCYVARVFELHAKFAWLGPANLWPGFTSRGPAWPRHSAISHVIPLRVLQTLNSYHWNCNVFGRSLKMTVGNYVRNLCGRGVAVVCGYCGRVPLSMGTAARPVSRSFRVCSCDWGCCTRSVGSAPLVIGCSGP